MDNLPGERCPECGRQFNALDSSTFGSTSKRADWLRWRRRVAILAAILVPLDIFFALLAYETVGEVNMVLLLFLAVVGNFVACFLLLIRLPKVSLIALVIVAVLIIPHQFVLGIKYCMITHEAKRIVNHLDQCLIRDGNAPPDLSGYTFCFSSIQEHFKYGPNKQHGGFFVSWYVGTRGTSHRYSPREGWRYYPD